MVDCIPSKISLVHSSKCRYLQRTIQKSLKYLFYNFTFILSLLKRIFFAVLFCKSMLDIDLLKRVCSSVEGERRKREMSYLICRSVFELSSPCNDCAPMGSKLCTIALVYDVAKMCADLFLWKQINRRNRMQWNLFLCVYVFYDIDILRDCLIISKIIHYLEQISSCFKKDSLWWIYLFLDHVPYESKA